MSTRVAIVGAGGGVGSSVAFNLLVREEPYDVTMVDGRSGMAVSHEMDLQQVIAAGASGSVSIVSLDDIAQADIVVVSAATPLTANHSRLVYLHDNARILNSVVDALGRDWPGVLVVVTNPVDPLLTWLYRTRALDRRRTVGYTANDSLRLRTAVGEALGVAPASVDAWVIGEHGDGCVPLLDRIAVDGSPVTLDDEQKRTAGEFVRGWYVRHVALDPSRSSTWTSGHSIARMVGALSRDTSELWPASIVLDGEYGINGIALTVPARLGRGGVEHVEEWDLSDAEARSLAIAAETVRDAADAIER